MIKSVAIYKITNPRGKVYIGSTIDFKRRASQYKNLNCKRQTKIHRSLLKYGFDNHKMEVIEYCDKDNRCEREIYYGNKFNVLSDKGLNCCLPKIGDSISHSNETRNKISKANKGRVLSDNSKNKIRYANIGKKASLESRLKMRQSHLAKEKSIYLSISNKLKGRKRSSLFCKKASERLFKPILCLNYGIFYSSIKECAFYNDIKYSTLVSSLNRGSSKKFITIQNA